MLNLNILIDSSKLLFFWSISFDPAEVQTGMASRDLTKPIYAVNFRHP
jgi:hypothetical protein